MAWMDPCWVDYYPELKELIKKNKGFTRADRQYLIDLQREIIGKIIPAYKKYQDDGKIEISTNPLYHPILPILMDINVAKNSTSKYGLPDCDFNFSDDAKKQTEISINLYENLFGKKPNGMWVPELSVSNDVLNMFSDYGIKWTISDESLLAESLGEDFIRDVRGNLEDPYKLSKVYTYVNSHNKCSTSVEDTKIGIYFRNSVFSNLIGFEYPHNDSVLAANDLYERIKLIQDKIQTSPDKDHIVLISMDGENSWENYADDGNKFLETLYGLICEDKTLETVTLSEYYEKNDKSKILNNVIPGSWINKNFQLWIAEPTKNKAWEYLAKVRNDLLTFEKQIDDENLKRAMWAELFVDEGSDWFWWFGEPNDSGQDNLFDYLFRRHLQNIYLMADKPIPDFLKTPLTMIVNSPSRYPKSLINPKITGEGDSPEWKNAGCIDIPSGPLTDSNQILSKICYGLGKDNLYLKIDFSHYTFEKIINEGIFYQIYIYLKNRSLKKSAEGKIRLVMRPEALTPIFKESFSHEIKFTFASDRDFPVEVAYSNKEGIWFSTLNNNIKYILGNVLEIEIPLTDIGMKQNDVVDFVVVDGILGHGGGAYPRDMFLTIENTNDANLIKNNF